MAIKSLDSKEKKVEFLKSQINLLMRDACLLFEKSQFLTVALKGHIASLRRPYDFFMKERNQNGVIVMEFKLHRNPMYASFLKILAVELAL